MSQQPIWKCIGHVGDVDPIAHGGGFIYVDETGVYGPEMSYFEPGSDEQWHKTEGDTPLLEFRIMLESGTREWWYSKLDSISSFTGIPLADLQETCVAANPIELAQLYSDLISYFGAEEFDSYPVTRTENEAYAKYAVEMKLARQ